MHLSRLASFKLYYVLTRAAANRGNESATAMVQRLRRSTPLSTLYGKVSFISCRHCATVYAILFAKLTLFGKSWSERNFRRKCQLWLPLGPGSFSFEQRGSPLGVAVLLWQR